MMKGMNPQMLKALGGAGMGGPGGGGMPDLSQLAAQMGGGNMQQMMKVAPRLPKWLTCESSKCRACFVGETPNRRTMGRRL